MIKDNHLYYSILIEKLKHIQKLEKRIIELEQQLKKAENKQFVSMRHLDAIASESCNINFPK